MWLFFGVASSHSALDVLRFVLRRKSHDLGNASILVNSCCPSLLKGFGLGCSFHPCPSCALRGRDLPTSDADIVRLPGFGLFAIGITFCARTFAQRSFWAAEIFLRADAESLLRVPAWIFPPLTLPRTERAASTCFRSFTRFVLRSLNCETTDTNPFRIAMSFPLGWGF